MYKEGYLFKRQRGRHHSNLKGLEFQKRFCSLTASSLRYKEKEKDQGWKGEFELSRIQLVEEVEHGVFGRNYCFQVGNKEEILYLASNTAEERKEWMKILKEAALSNANEMLPQYHWGAYGLLYNNHWSCCNHPQRKALGCFPVTWREPTNVKPTFQRSGSLECHKLPSSESSMSITSSGTLTESLKSTSTISAELEDISDLDSTDDSSMRRRLRTDSGISSTGSTRPPSEASLDSLQVEESKVAGDSPLVKPKNKVHLDRVEEEGESDQPKELLEHGHKNYDYREQPVQAGISKAVTSLLFMENSTLVAGSSEDHHIHILNVDLSVKDDIELSGSVMAIDKWGHYLAIGSTIVQVLDVNKEGKKAIIADDEPIMNPPQHLAAFSSKGDLVTASIEDKIVKVWPPPSPGSIIITEPQSVIDVSKEPGSICSLKMAQPWVAVGMSEPEAGERKSVHLINWKLKKERHSFDAGCGDTLATAFSSNGRHIATGCGTSLHIWETKRGTPQGGSKDGITTDAPISSLCWSPDGNHLSVGLTTGEVKVLQVSREKINPILTLCSPLASSSATSVTYSKDGKLFAVGYKSGLVKLWKACQSGDPRDEIEINHEFVDLPKPKGPLHGLLLTRVKTLEFTSSGGEYESPHDHYKLSIPEGAIPEGKTISIQCGVVPNGPFGRFEYPSGMTPVSPIVSLCSEQYVNFQKPIQLTLPHFIICKSEEECQSLVFLKAKHNAITTDTEEVFHFEPAEGKPSFTANCEYATLSTHHLCLNCLAAPNINLKATDQANFCLTTITPSNIDQSGFEIHFCLSYYLETCLQTIRDQYDDSKYNIRQNRITFPGKESILAISFQHPLTGWQVLQQDRQKITMKDVSFWDQFKSPIELGLACKNRDYPPRLVLEISGRNAERDDVLTVKFDGPKEDLVRRIALTQDRPNSVTTGTQTDSELPTAIPEVHPIEESHMGDHPTVGTNNPGIPQIYPDSPYLSTNPHSSQLVYTPSSGADAVQSDLQPFTSKASYSGGGSSITKEESIPGSIPNGYLPIDEQN